MYLYSVFSLIFTFCVFQSINARRSVSSRDWPEDQPEYEIIPPMKAVWSCNFERHDCGISNDVLFGDYFQLSKTQISPYIEKRDVLLLNITKIDSNPSGARLITPYFEAKRHSKGCLTMDYIVGGNGVKNMLVYQQETENRCVWSAISGNTFLKPSVDWQKLSLTVDLKYGDPRYFIESHFDNRPPNTGFVAISEIRFFHNACNKNDANQCQHLMSDEPEDSTDYPNDLP